MRLTHLISCRVQICGLLVAIPYVLTRGILPVIAGGFLSAEVLQALFLYGWLAEAMLVGSFLLSGQLQRGFTLLHNSVRDEKYMVGRELRNYSREEAAVATVTR